MRGPETWGAVSRVQRLSMGCSAEHSQPRKAARVGEVAESSAGAGSLVVGPHLRRELTD